MGRVLAGILEQGITELTTDERDRSAVLLEAATAAAVDTATVEALLDEGTTALPAETTVRRLVEAVARNADDAIAAARGDGDLFDGDELGEHEPVVAEGARIVEAAGDGEQPGTRRYKVVVIRPGRAKGPGRRFYPTRMLESDATKFGGQPIFFNHEDLATILKRGHGSRDPRDLCGWLQEGTWYEPGYSEPDDAANGRRPGAVMGFADFATEAADHIDRFPRALSLSINMDSTRIQVGRAETGEMAPLVEGVIKGSGSVDLITGEAGAGGRVLERLRESAELRYRPGHADLAGLDDDRLIEAVRARPELLARLRDDAPPPNPGGTVDPNEVIDAIAGDEAAQTRLVEALASSPALDRVVEARMAEREDAIREDATAESQRILDLRDLRDEAHRLIESHEVVGRFGSFVEDLKGRYTLRDGRHPSPALDVYPEVAEDGTTVTKTSRQVLVEAVAADLEREANKLREAAPTRVRSLGGPAPEGAPEGGTGGEGGSGGEPAKRTDATAERLGLDAERVRELQGV